MARDRGLLKHDPDQLAALVAGIRAVPHGEELMAYALTGIDAAASWLAVQQDIVARARDRLRTAAAAAERPPSAAQAGCGAGLMVKEARLEHPFATAMRKVDLAVPLLTVDIVGARAANRESMTEDQALHPVIRESLITLIILVRLLQLKLIAYEPLEIAEFIRTVSQANLAAVKANLELLALERARDAAR